MRIIYEVTVLGWEKHNARVKKGFEYFMLSNRFFDDDKIATLTSLERLLFVAILSRCADERAATTRPTRDQLLTMLGQRRYDIATALTHLQENQLVTWQKIQPFNKEKRIEENINEEKRIEEKKKREKRKELSVPLSEPPPPTSAKKLFEIWNEYCGALPPAKKLNPSRERRIKAIWDRLPEAEWIEVVRKLSLSDFCNGKNDRGWKADFDFFIKPETWSRVLEGRYDNRQKQNDLFMTPAMQRAANNQKILQRLNEESNDE